ncbi:MAG: hypothetical protein IKU87_00420 [Clostridia bacterium]|nr:hypothetical protein [Clostridia bacterium]
MKIKKLCVVLSAVFVCISLVSCGGMAKTDDDLNGGVKTDKGYAEKVVVDNEICTFKITGVNPDGALGYTLNVFLENKTDEDLMFSLGKVSVNGFMCDPFWASEVDDRKKAKSDINFSKEEFMTYGIEKVENIEFTLIVYDEDDWMKGNLVEQKYTFKP